MKSKKQIIILAAVAAVFLLQRGSARAEDAPVVTMKAERLREGDRQLKVTCEGSGEAEVTNGKLRFTYDTDYLTLESDQAGKALDGASTQINDPLTGSKEEGEIVLVFASGKAIQGKGTLAELNFRVKEQVKEGDTCKIDVQVEEFSFDGVSLNAAGKGISVTAGKAGEGQTGSETESREPDSKETGKASDSGKAGNTREENSNRGASGTGGRTTEQVKTGDRTQMALPAIGFLASIALSVGLWGHFRARLR